ncbi:DNA (cytosine-5)-methyltransferase 1 [Hordeum vulgare]|nr:DNA (cytosine-5)-methyltransferase 1 [Hordeum vulgare]
MFSTTGPLSVRVSPPQGAAGRGGGAGPRAGGRALAQARPDVLYVNVGDGDSDHAGEGCGAPEGPGGRVAEDAAHAPWRAEGGLQHGAVGGDGASELADAGRPRDVRGREPVLDRPQEVGREVVSAHRGRHLRIGFGREGAVSGAAGHGDWKEEREDRAGAVRAQLPDRLLLATKRLQEGATSESSAGSPLYTSLRAIIPAGEQQQQQQAVAAAAASVGDDAKRKSGRRSRMMDLGKKMGDKLEEFAPSLVSALTSTGTSASSASAFATSPVSSSTSTGILASSASTISSVPLASVLAPSSYSVSATHAQTSPGLASPSYCSPAPTTVASSAPASTTVSRAVVVAPLAPEASISLRPSTTPLAAQTCSSSMASSAAEALLITSFAPLSSSTGTSATSASALAPSASSSSENGCVALYLYQAGPNEENYIGRITEFFEGTDNGLYFTCRWFFRVEDTVISQELLDVHDHNHDPKRVFLSEEKNDNVIESIISKVNIIYVDPSKTPQERDQLISNSDLYYEMSYSVAYLTFETIPAENDGATDSEVASDISCEEGKPVADPAASSSARRETTTLLDLYSGCGAMSTGLCLGAALSGINLNTKWAVDMNEYACESLKHNHPSTQAPNANI